MKRLVEAARKVAERKAKYCEHCGGDGGICKSDGTQYNYICDDTYCSDCEGGKPCPTCARIREIAEWCWHYNSKQTILGWNNLPSTSKCDICKRFKSGNINPTFTVQTVRKLLEDLGEWERFYLALFDSWFNKKQVADILTTDSLIIEAAAEYLEGLL